MGQLTPGQVATADGEVYAVVGTDGRKTYYGRIGRDPDATYAATEARWDAFARLMFRYGVEPVTDEPTFTTDDLTHACVVDHYLLQELGVDL